MRQTLMLATMAVMTACGAGGNTPWDQNHDGLITACEGLNPQACDATSGCERAPVACAMICRDDGHGGCVPCAAGPDVCQPTPPPPVLDCSHLPINLCAVTPRCEVVHAQDCSGSGVAAPSPSDPSVPPLPGCGTGECHASESCVNRGPVQCEALSSDACLAQPGCALQGADVRCDVACDSSGNCPPCASAQLRCVTVPPADVCGSRDPNVCSIDGRCVLEQGPVCEIACVAGGVCPPCATAQLRCVAAPPPDLCGAREPGVCALDGQCEFVQALCDAVCNPDGSCPPCAAPAPVCVPARPVDVCAGRDLNSCAVDGRCAVEAWACPAICKPDGLGGCVPCDAPPPSCVPVAPSRCEGLDRGSCEAAGCMVMPLGIACTQDCRDDGHGGCLPCKDFVCVDGGTGGGTSPPQPAPPQP